MSSSSIKKRNNDAYMLLSQNDSSLLPSSSSVAAEEASSLSSPPPPPSLSLSTMTVTTSATSSATTIITAAVVTNDDSTMAAATSGFAAVKSSIKDDNDEDDGATAATLDDDSARIDSKFQVKWETMIEKKKSSADDSHNLNTRDFPSRLKPVSLKKRDRHLIDVTPFGPYINEREYSANAYFYGPFLKLPPVNLVRLVRGDDDDDDDDDDESAVVVATVLHRVRRYYKMKRSLFFTENKISTKFFVEEADMNDYDDDATTGDENNEFGVNSSELNAVTILRIDDHVVENNELALKLPKNISMKTRIVREKFNWRGIEVRGTGAIETPIRESDAVNWERALVSVPTTKTLDIVYWYLDVYYPETGFTSQGERLDVLCKKTKHSSSSSSSLSALSSPAVTHVRNENDTTTNLVVDVSEDSVIEIVDDDDETLAKKNDDDKQEEEEEKKKKNISSNSEEIVILDETIPIPSNRKRSGGSSSSSSSSSLTHNIFYDDTEDENLVEMEMPKRRRQERLKRYTFGVSFRRHLNDKNEEGVATFKEGPCETNIECEDEIYGNVFLEIFEAICRMYQWQYTVDSPGHVEPTLNDRRRLKRFAVSETASTLTDRQIRIVSNLSLIRKKIDLSDQTRHQRGGEGGGGEEEDYGRSRLDALASETFDSSVSPLAVSLTHRNKLAMMEFNRFLAYKIVIDSRREDEEENEERAEDDLDFENYFNIILE